MSKLCQQENMEWTHLPDFRDKYLLVMHCRVSGWITLKKGAQIFCTSPILAVWIHSQPSYDDSAAQYGINIKPFVVF